MSPSPGLRLPTPQPQSFIDQPATKGQYGERPPTPAAPPYSPITPLLTSTDLASGENAYLHGPPEDVLQPPPPVSFSESDNPDAMALRSAISILQTQRQQSQRDMKALEEQKKVALADVEGFVDAVAAGRVRTTRSGGLIVGPTPSMEWEDSTDGSQGDNKDTGGDLDEEAVGSAIGIMDIPGPQNVIRCPPINWAKYHIVGNPLDKLHDEQRRRPTAGQPHTDEEPTRTTEHVIAAPYSPWTDRLPESSMRTRSVAKKEG